YLSLALALMARAHDELVGRLVGPRLHALGGLAPGRNRMPATGGAAFAAAMRMVDRVHGHAAIVRALAQPAATTSLAEIDIAVIRIGHGADRGEACTGHDALLARVQAQDRPPLIASVDLRTGSAGARDLAALPRLHLHNMDDGTDGHGRKRHRIARPDLDRLLARDHA